jgi:nucleoside-diphosphate kinase
MERTLVLIKPDAFHRSMVGRIISKFEEKGLKLIGSKLLWVDDLKLDEQYSHLASKPFFSEIKDFMKSGPIMATCWEGVDCIKTVRLICGTTMAREAEPGTIRGDWAMSIMCNLVHSSESVEHAEKEISMYFNQNELLSYRLNNESFLYSKRE